MLVLTVLFVFLFLVPKNAFASPTVNNITDNRSSYPNSKIPKFEKFELTFQVDDLSATNFYLPYDSEPPTGAEWGRDGVEVTADFSKDNWQTTVKSQPGFYYQDFDWQTKNNRDWIYPLGTYSWKVRFSPPEVGNWRYRIRVRDRGGATQTADGTFEVVESSNHGFIKVSPDDPRYFEYSDGTYFPGLGYNYRPNIINIDANTPRLAQMKANGIQVPRIWLSSWGIYGSAWNPWYSIPQDYDGYLPRTGLSADANSFRLKLVYRSSNPNQPSCTDDCSFWKANRFIGWQSPQPALKQNTNYTVRVWYSAANITGPRDPSNPNYGLVAKISSNWLEKPHNSGQGTVVTTYGGNESGQTIYGNWNSGNNNYLPFLYVTLENVIDPGPGSSAPVAYISRIEVIENPTGGGGPNVIYKPEMDHLLYMDQRNSRAFDKLLENAEDNDLYLRLVLLEKDEFIQNHIDFSGTKRTDDPPNLFYGNGYTDTAVRWYQKAWFRYVQARWGYSANIHSYELINEGDPNLANHYILTDVMGSFMHQFANSHLVSTSNWHSFPASQWSAYQNIDFADVHYYQPRSATSELEDPSLATYNRSMAYGAQRPGGAGKPVIRGETGFVESGSDPSITDFNQDTTGVWLHDFTWGQINHGGLMESYWYVEGADGHIKNSQTGRDFQSIYGTFYRFIKDVPLNRGGYEDIAATSSNSQLRVWGQKNLSTQKAHFWVKNVNHKWRDVAQSVNIPPQSGTVTISGFNPNQTLTLETWDTYTGQISNTQNIQTNSQGAVSIAVNNLTSDVAYRIGQYGTQPTNPPTLIGDVNHDGTVNIQDYQLLSLAFGKTIGQTGYNVNADFNQDSVINIQDYQLLSTNFGRSQ